MILQYVSLINITLASDYFPHFHIAICDFIYSFNILEKGAFQIFALWQLKIVVM